MEKQINELNENTIVEMIYDKINAYWGKFPNLWNCSSKDDIASEVAIDLYRPRKADGVPHIVHYYKTAGERSLAPLIGMLVYNNLQAEARIIYSTGNRNVEARRNVYSALSLETPIAGLDEDICLGDTISDDTVNISRDVDYIMLFDSLPDKRIDGVYYKVGDKYVVASYKSVLKDLLDGYNLSQLGEKLYKQNKSGIYCKFRDISSVVKQMKQDFKEFLHSEYGFSESDFAAGGTIL